MQPITDKRSRVIHVAADGAKLKPMCRPHTRVTFHPTLRRQDMSVCEVCAERELIKRYENGER